MMHSLLLAPLLLASPSHAGELGGETGGLWGDAAIGLGAGGRPFAAGIAWTAAVGGFVGRHDNAFAVGRRWGVGLRARQDVEPQAPRRAMRTAIALDVHRALDLLIASVHVGGFAGPWLATPLDGGPTVPAGVTARLSAGATWRRHRFVGLHARVDAGVDVDLRSTAPAAVAPALGVTIGVSWARPTGGSSGR